MDDKFYTFVGTIIILGLVGWLLSRIFHQGRLSGIRKAVTDLSRQCSFHYESKDDELPEKVVKALDYMKGALQRGKGAKGRSELYLVGAGMLGDAMGEAAWQKGFEAGRQWTDPKTGETRIDFTRQEILDLANMAHVGFEHMISDPEGFRDEMDAERASETIRLVESNKPADTIDESDPYALAFNRSTMIWQRFSGAPTT